MATLSDAHRPQMIHVADVVTRPKFFRSWERQRHTRVHWLVECVAEFMGVFFYVYAGVGSQASMVIGTLSNQPALGSLLQVGLAYAVGVVLAIVICAPTSGGHLNPCVTIVFAAFRGFPWKKVPQYIIAQILGAYVACMLIYLQWKGNITLVEASLSAAGKLDAIQFTPSGPAGIFGLYTQPSANLGFVFANEFFVDFILALVVWACLDPSNFFTPPAAVPWIIGFGYATAIWGYSPNGLAANSARDIGGRMAALTIYGTAASGGKYAAIAALTNIAAMFLSTIFYEFIFVDSSRVLPPAQRDYLYGHKAHLEHRDVRYVGSTGRSSESSLRNGEKGGGAKMSE